MLWLATVLAHPMGGVMPSHDLGLEVQEDGLLVRYAARIPTHDVLREIGEQDFGPEEAAAYNLRRLEELRQELVLEVDGTRRPWDSHEPTAESGRGNSRFVLYEQVLSATFAGGRVHLRNGNTPDQLSYHRADVVVAPFWVVEDCTLWGQVEHGKVRKSRTGVWRLEEDSRELELLVRPSTALESAGIDGPRSVDEALPPPLPWTVVVGAVSVVLAALLGLRAALRRRGALPA